MTAKINIDLVDGILLADGWHTVDRNSFEVNNFEFLAKSVSMKQGERNSVGGPEKLTSSIGAKWIQPDGTEIFCPLTAILAVRYAHREAPSKAPGFTIGPKRQASLDM